MRVHRLEMTAFGPFAGHQVVDFEPLNAAGVFLLTGHTGAGKTSILDAVCFGLFGRVPGVRDKARRYRSDHAPATVPPRVVLEVTLQGRRLRLTRSPAWRRPARRGKSATVEEKAKATAEELVGDRWVVRSSRADEVGQLVSGLLGLDRDQFCQVVMLPQGEFQAFLRSGGRDRQHILESIFGTQRFQAVERWLVEHRRQQARRCRDHEESLSTIVARVQEVCASAATHVLARPPDTSDDYPEQLAALGSLVEVGTVAVTRAIERSADASLRAKQTRHALDETRTLAERQSRHRDALRRHTALVATKDLVADREQRIRRARAAATIMPLVTMVDEATTTCVRAARAADVAAARCHRLAGLARRDLSSAEAVDLVLTGLVARHSRLEGLAAVETECDRLRLEVIADTEAQALLAARVRELGEQVVADPGAIASLRTDLAELTRAVERAAGARATLADTGLVLAAAADVERLDGSLALLQRQRLGARELLMDATQVWLGARERYLAGVAAELAGELGEHDACPVCGSTLHPAPALPQPEHVSGPQEADLLAEVTAAREVLSVVDTAIIEAERARAEALARSRGLSPAEASTVHAAAKDQLARSRAATAERGLLSAELETLVAAADARRMARDTATTELARLSERIVGSQRLLAAQQARLDKEVGPHQRVSALLADLAIQAAGCRTLHEAVRGAEEATRAATQADDRLSATLTGSEFESATAVVAAALPDAEVAAIDALNRSHAAELAGVSRTLADPTLLAAVALPTPDLPALEDQADSMSRAAAEAAAAAADLERRQTRLEALQIELQAGAAALGPLRAAKDLADDVAGLCTGNSPDNPTRTALSHYVLSARLAQVVAAANDRLGSICGGRYQLAHTMTREAGDNRGGLGLLVSDTHTDRTRDPSTLSGGETFYVSLSLALGLADVVTNEAGGAELSTLFVDEGFGALDDDTRDEVLDELDALRSGGRSIGLVSHLGELRTRFPVQLHVIGSHGGSRCVLVGADEAEWEG